MDRLEALQAFVRLVDVGTFTAVAQEMRVKQSTVSKWIAALEQELQVQLLERTTRAKHITEEGQQLYESAQRILQEYDAVVASLQREDDRLQGRLRLSLPVVFGQMYVLPHLISFAKEHPELHIDIEYSDRYINLVEAGFDASVRVGIPEDSTLRARKLGETRRHLVASPGYLRSHGTPEQPSDLAEHQCLLHTGVETSKIWKLRGGEVDYKIRVTGKVRANHSETLRAFAKADCGIALLATWLIQDDLRAGTLQQLLPTYELPSAPIYGLMPPGTYIPPRVRRCIDYLQTKLSSTLPTAKQEHSI